MVSVFSNQIQLFKSGFAPNLASILTSMLPIGGKCKSLAFKAHCKMTDDLGNT